MEQTINEREATNVRRPTADQAQTILDTRPVGRWLNEHAGRGYTVNLSTVLSEVSIGASAIRAHRGYTEAEREAADAWADAPWPARRAAAMELTDRINERLAA